MKTLEYYEVCEYTQEGMEINMGNFLDKGDAIEFAADKGFFGLSAPIKLKNLLLYENVKEAEMALEKRKKTKKIGGFSHV